ncbi:hypothetical protein EVD20_15770 [Elizabethkingia bruuniana]|nr:hypothetical protein [Elizabethkingia bruuniana]QDZ63729.1 hypothetical protein EVD20_15770 [Elizabethkingia bruuniana]
MIKKITGIVNSIKTFLSEVKDLVTDLAEKGIEFLKILNAFNCGVLNGLVGLVQCILYILEFLLQPTTAFSYTQYLERRDLLEKAEDVIDWVSENAPKFLQGIKDLFKASGDLSLLDLEGMLDKMKEYFGNISRYTIAFYVGVVVFEVLINILLLVFTEGVGNVVKGVTYVQKITNTLKVLIRETVSVVTMGVTDLLAFLSKFMVSFGKACAKGFKGFIKWIEDLLAGAKKGKNIDDVLSDLEKYNTKADPVVELFGPGFNSHPREWSKLIKELIKNKVEIIYKDSEALAYVPGYSKGKPGQIILNKEASFSALLHEFEHFVTDKNAGYLGFEGVYDPNFRTMSEIISYEKEIDFVKKNGNNSEIINRLKINLKEEVDDFSKRIGAPTDKKILEKLDNLLKH